MACGKGEMILNVIGKKPAQDYSVCVQVFLKKENDLWIKKHG